MTFADQKKRILSRADRSKKQEVDKEIVPLLAAINAHPHYVTTSSCAGRIVLFTQQDLNKKQTFEWFFVSHTMVKFLDISKAMEHLPSGLVWLRVEGMIVHVCSETMEDASRLLQVASPLGFKRSGIISILPKVMLEIASTEKMDVPIAKNQKILISKEYLKLVLSLANQRMKRNIAKIGRLKTAIEKQLGMKRDD